MRDTTKIAAVVRAALSETFNSVNIIQVNVTSDMDDEEVLNIEVVFEGTPKDLDARKVTGAVRQVRPKLTEMGEWAFPLLSFISKSDASRLELAWYWEVHDGENRREASQDPRCRDDQKVDVA